MAVNPAGFQQVWDFGAPTIFTATARETIVEGDIVFASGATGVVSSGTTSYAAGDVLVATGATGSLVLGVAVIGAASGALVPVCTRGAIILPVGGNIDASAVVQADGSHAITASAVYNDVLGRTLTAGASGGFCIVGVNII